MNVTANDLIKHLKKLGQHRTILISYDINSGDTWPINLDDFKLWSLEYSEPDRPIVFDLNKLV